MGAYRVSPGDAIAAFLDAMRRRGLVPPPELITVAAFSLPGRRRARRQTRWRVYPPSRRAPGGWFSELEDGQPGSPGATRMVRPTS